MPTKARLVRKRHLTTGPAQPVAATKRRFIHCLATVVATEELAKARPHQSDSRPIRIMDANDDQILEEGLQIDGINGLQTGMGAPFAISFPAGRLPKIEQGRQTR